jgi:hypothetical protein
VVAAVLIGSDTVPAGAGGGAVDPVPASSVAGGSVAGGDASSAPAEHAAINSAAAINGAVTFVRCMWHTPSHSLCL